MALSFMRRHRRWLFIFLWLVILAFIILYIPAFLNVEEGSQSEIIARVAGQPISRGQFLRVYFDQRRLLEQMSRERADRERLKYELRILPERVFRDLVEQRLLALEARRLGVEVDDAAVARAISNDPGFRVGDRFDPAEYRRRLELRRISVEEYEAQVRAELRGARVISLITAGVSVTPADVEKEYRRQTERLRAEYVLIDVEPFRTDVKVTDADVSKRFEERKEAYRIPEKRVVDYILIDRAQLQAQAEVTGGDIETYLEQNEDDFRAEEQVCARHVLIKIAADGESTSGHREDEARRIAAGLLRQLRDGADFAELARESSEDPGSAASGGDLGCFPRASMVREFANAAFALDPGQLSELVRTPYGFHIIQAMSRQGGDLPPLDLLKDQVRRILVDRRAEELLEQKAAEAVAQLGQGRKLEEAAQAIGISLEKSAPLARGETPEPLVSRQLVARAFELNAVGQAHPEPFAVPRGYAFIALAEIQPSRLPDLADVKGEVQRDLERSLALDMARTRAQEVRQRVQKEGLTKAAKAFGLERRETAGLVGRGQALGDLGSSFAIEKAVFSLEPNELSDPVRVASGFAVLRVTEKTPFDPESFDRQKASIEESLLNRRRRQLFQSFLDQSWRRFSVERTAAYRKVMAID
ncbi:MAG: peptidylprolyl isomerase [Vicinamibacteria bacterium]|nr:peptidylprolyl isomerase [Vicinamibacteria bacterium]